MVEFKRVTLREIAAEKGLVGGPFGSSLVGRDYVDSGVPVIRGENLSRGPWISGSFVFVSEEKFDRDLHRNSAMPGDVVYTQRGTLGQVALVGEGQFSRYVVSQSQMRLRVDPRIADARYVYFASSSPEFRRQVGDNAISTGVPHINLGILARLDIPLPDLAGQRAIADVLGALDDKIAANTKLASTADELVRSWYERTSCQASATASVGSLAVQVRDLVDPSEVEEGEIYVGLEHVPRRHMWLNDAGQAASVTSTKAAFRANDVLFGKLRPYFHKVVAAPVSGVSSTDILVLRARESRLSGFLLAAVASDQVVERSTAASEGTRMPRTSWADLAKIDIPWPGDDAALRFSARVVELRRRVEAALNENRTLAATRDALLPQLMSGTLRVKDAERVVSEVA